MFGDFFLFSAQNRDRGRVLVIVRTVPSGYPWSSMGTSRHVSLEFNNPNWKSAISVAIYRYAGTEGPMPQSYLQKYLCYENEFNSQKPCVMET